MGGHLHRTPVLVILAMPIRAAPNTHGKEDAPAERYRPNDTARKQFFTDVVTDGSTLSYPHRRSQWLRCLTPKPHPPCPRLESAPRYTAKNDQTQEVSV